jgi:hypothetical protein
MFALRFVSSLLLVLVLAPGALADGELRQGDRVLLRIDHGAGPDCEASPQACDVQLVRRLTGYRFFSAELRAGALAERIADEVAIGGVGAIELTAARGILPSGDFDFGRLEGALVVPDGAFRGRLVAMESRTALFCTDSVDGSVHLPLLGMLHRSCRRDAVLAVDASIAALQWDTSIDRLAATWAELGPSLEVLGNGHGTDRLLSSLALALTVDARTLLFRDDPDAAGSDQSSLGATVAMRFRWLSPQWEIAARAGHRAPIVGGRGILEDTQSGGDATLRHNLSAGSHVILRPGFQLAASSAPHPEVAFGSLVPVTSQTGVFLGLESGVLHDALGI